FDAEQAGTSAGILSAEEGRFFDGQWRNTLWLGGDQTNQGRQLRLEAGRFSIQRVRLYRYCGGARSPGAVAAPWGLLNGSGGRVPPVAVPPRQELVYSETKVGVEAGLRNPILRSCV